MGNRGNRKVTRQVKVRTRQDAINSVIRLGLEGGEQFRDIAKQISMDFHLDKKKALGMVMAEHKRTATKWMDLDEQSRETANALF